MVDFAKMLQEMNEEKARRATLSPQERAREDAAAEEKRARDMERLEDREFFAGRKLRTLSGTLSGEERSTMKGDRVLMAHNDRGRVDVVLPGNRGARGANEAGRSALNAAVVRSESERGGSAAVAFEAEGFFRSRSWKDREGQERKAWDFVTTQVSFTHEGQKHTLGRAISPEVSRPESVAPAAAPASNRRGHDEAR